jgi:DNA-binding response OmpR family regulator
MIAEDDAEFRSLLADTLLEDGCAVRTASDGRELLAMLSAVSRGEMPMPSILVMDVRMPRCSGMDVLNALRLADWEVPVVIITGFGDAELHANAGTLGAAVVLDKPFELDTLRCIVRVISVDPRAARPSKDDAQDADATLVAVRRTKGGHS